MHASDEEAYTVFDELFQPIIQDIHPEYDVKYSYKKDFEPAGCKAFGESTIRESNRIPLLRLMAKRNFKGYPFTPMMSTELKI